MSSKELPEVPDMPASGGSFGYADAFGPRRERFTRPSALGFSDDMAAGGYNYEDQYIHHRPISYTDGMSPAPAYATNVRPTGLFPPIPIDVQYNAPLVANASFASNPTPHRRTTEYPTSAPPVPHEYPWRNDPVPSSVPETVESGDDIAAAPIAAVPSGDNSGYMLSANDAHEAREALAAGEILASREFPSAKMIDVPTSASTGFSGSSAILMDMLAPVAREDMEPDLPPMPPARPAHSMYPVRDVYNTGHYTYPVHATQHTHPVHQVHPMHTAQSVPQSLPPFEVSVAAVPAVPPASQVAPPVAPSCATGLPRPCVIFEYCDRCRWQHRATWMQTELLITFSAKEAADGTSSKASGGGYIASTMLLPCAAPETAGRFRVWLVTEQPRAHSQVEIHLLWDRKSQGGFPDLAELKRLVRDKIAPGLSLGHSEKRM